MKKSLVISADWETLAEGSPEERACFAALGIAFNDLWLTEGRDKFVNRIRQAPFLSGYHLAEWIVWNWWRLRWEPKSASTSQSDEWLFAHSLATIGAGYAWPNITIFSDGERVALIAKPTSDASSFRYISDFAAFVSASEWESVADSFVSQVIGQLDAEGIQDSNLQVLWNDLSQERLDPGQVRRRKLEALLGKEPDEASSALIEQIIADAKVLGEDAANEVAAESGARGRAHTAEELQLLARSRGVDASPRDAIQLASGSGLPQIGKAPAWLLGQKAAQAVRERAKLHSDPLSNTKLAELAGVLDRALLDNGLRGDFAFALDQTHNASRVVLRSKWETGRRFELARLLGDRILAGPGGKLFPATSTRTYRQQMQRSFAAELLCPYEALEDVLGSDLSDDAILDAAEEFNVSERTVRTLLVNHGRLPREEIDTDAEPVQQVA